MKRGFVVIPATCCLILAILACNAPLSQAGSQPDYAATITAQVAAIGQAGAQGGSTASATATATPSPITALVKANTNCRKGPGTSYAIVVSLTAGQSVTVVGQDTADNYWIVATPDGSGTCWLWGQVSTVTGDTSGLPQMPPSQAPTPKPSKTPKPAAGSTAPAAPTGVKVQVYNGCTATKSGLVGYKITYTVLITWTDNDPAATGFHVYQGSTLLGSQEATPLGIPNQYSGSGTIEGNSDATNISFGVQAYNKAASSQIVEAIGKCQ